MDPVTVTAVAAAANAAIAAAGNALGLFDKIADQMARFLQGKRAASAEKPHRMHIAQEGDAIVSRDNGRELKRITAADLAKLDPGLLRHVKVYEQSMQKAYDLWAAVYPQRNDSADPIVNAKVDQQLRKIVRDVKGDLDGLLQFIEGNGMWLDDHYMEYRDLVKKA